MLAPAPRRLKLTTLKAIWRDQIMSDPQLTYSTRVVGYFMADYITMTQTEQVYRETGRVVIFPSQQTLSDQTGANTDTVMLAIAALIAQGHLSRLKHGNQFTGANSYRVHIRTAA